MNFLITIVFIVLQTLVNCELDLPFCPGPPQWPPEPPKPPKPDIYPPYPDPYPEPNRPHSECVENYPDKKTKIKSIAFSPIQLINVLENVVLICKPKYGNIVKRIEVVNNRLQYNASCNAVLSGIEHNPGTIYYAIIQTSYGEKSVPLNARTYKYKANYNMATEMFSEFAELNDCICEGSTLSSLSVWVSRDPTQGCCSDGVKESTAVFYRVEIRGRKCCNIECNLLSATDVYTNQLLHN